MLTEYTAHYNTARPHQGIDQRVPEHASQTKTAAVTELDTVRVRRTAVLGGVTGEYHITA